MSTSADPERCPARGVSAFVDMGGFSERLKKACELARPRIEWSQTAIGKALNVSKQTADRWMGDGQPSADTLFTVADALRRHGVPAMYADPRWLATGARTLEHGHAAGEPAGPYYSAGVERTEDEMLLSLIRTFLDTDDEGRANLVKAAETFKQAHGRSAPGRSKGSKRR